MIQVRDEAFKYYFHFMEKRMDVFWSKYEGRKYPWTDDTILRKHKFTNVYRVCDRVSQYLIKNVICNAQQKYSDQDLFLRILIFKVFNRIDTWEYIEQKTGGLCVKTFNADILSKLLADRIDSQPIFNSAYLMTGSHQSFKQYDSKHERWLRMIDKEFVKGSRMSQILSSKSMKEIFDIFSSCPFIGGFLAYQYTIDLNYSDLIDYDENSFVKAGIGAIRGIKKCFTDLGKHTYEDAIRYTYDNLDKYRERYGFNNFKNLFGREPTLIDLQNCFCETDKYLRVQMPELNLENTRIKQIYKPSGPPIEYYFPPKWNLDVQR
jgi:hypothetical protein